MVWVFPDRCNSTLIFFDRQQDFCWLELGTEQSFESSHGMSNFQAFFGGGVAT